MEQILFRTMLAAVVLAPLPLASVPIWAWGCLSVVAGLSMSGWAMLSYAGATNQWASPKITWPIALPFFLAITWMCVQSLSLTPSSWHHPLWRDLANGLSLSYHGSVGLETGRAWAGIAKILTYASFFWLGAMLGRQTTNAQTVLKVVALAAVCYATYGLIEQFTGTQTILWMHKWAHLDDLTATFANRNHYATYAGMALIIVIALLTKSYSEAIEPCRNRAEIISQTIGFVEKRGWQYLVGATILIASIFYSHSRAGSVSTLLGVIAFFIADSLAKSTKRKKSTSLWLGAGFLLFVILVFAVGGKGIDQRLAGTDMQQEERPIVYHLTMRAIMDQPLLGTGLGSYEQVFRFYRTPAVRGIYDYAHNTYLETALELGIPATLLLIAPVFYIVGCNVYGIRVRRRDSVYPCIGVGISTLVGVHAITDFSIQIPAVAVTYYWLLGVTFSQSWRSEPSREIASNLT